MISGDFKNRSDVRIAAPNVKENDWVSRGLGDDSRPLPPTILIPTSLK